MNTCKIKKSDLEELVELKNSVNANMMDSLSFFYAADRVINSMVTFTARKLIENANLTASTWESDMNREGSS
jgi:hypothetical protein